MSPWSEADWLDEPESVVDDRRVYAVVSSERTAGELRALLRIEAAARRYFEAIEEPTVREGFDSPDDYYHTGPTSYELLDRLRDALEHAA